MRGGELEEAGPVEELDRGATWEMEVTSVPAWE
jgi:hypothetical protein